MIAAVRRRDSRDGVDDVRRQDAQQLAGFVRECVTAGIGRRACVVHLSRLGPDKIRPQHQRLARAALEPLAHADRARLFTLPNQDIVTIWRGAAETALATSRSAIIHLFTDSELQPSASGASVDGPLDMLWEELELPSGAERLLAMAEASDEPSPPPKRVDCVPLDPRGLAQLEAALAHADVARFARRRGVYGLLPEGGWQLRWDKRYLSVEELADSLAPNTAPQADPWLFRRLTRTLDRRMLVLLSAPGELAQAGPFAINLNISSILAPEFLRFDAALPAALRGRVTIDLLPADVLSDPAAFLFARDFARTRGYRLMLRGLSADLLPVFPMDRLGVDLLQLRWSAEVAGLAGLDPELDPACVVLSHADGVAALDWGRARGITLFQGQAVATAGVRGLRAG